MSAVADTSIIINAPMDLVWDMTNDVESWPQLYTEYSKSKGQSMLNAVNIVVDLFFK